jgi:hypothetical protein
MRQFGFFHPLWMSFYSKELYADVAWKWQGTGFLYLLFLLTVCWILVTVQIHRGLSSFIDVEGPAFVDKVPDIEIANGRATVDAPQPLIVKDPNTGSPLLIVDTTGKYNSLKDTPGKILLTATTFETRDDFGKIQSIPLSQMPPMKINKGMVVEWMETLRAWGAIVILLVCLPCSFVYRIVQTLLYAAIGTIFCQSFRRNLEYGRLLRLAVVAVTPAILLGTLLSLVYTNSCGFWLIWLGMSLGYLYFGVKSAIQAAPPPPLQPAVAPAEVRPPGTV